MLTENHDPGLQTSDCNHERSHIGLDRAYCSDCKREFQPYTKEYQQLLHQPLVINHPDPKPGDYVTLLGDRPNRVYKILKTEGGHAVCKPIDGEGGSRNVAYWKLRAYCPTEQLPGETHTSHITHTPAPPLSGATPTASAPDTPAPPLSGATPTASAPDTPAPPPSGATPTASAPDTPAPPPSGATSSPAAPDTPAPTHWAEAYAPGQRDTKYFRYVWMHGRKMCRAHIPGGNVRSAKAQSNLAAVEEAIAAGRNSTEILELIRRLRGGGQT